MDLFDLLLTRRSIRQYTGQPVSQEDLRAVLAAGLLSPSSRSRRPWELVVVQDPAMLEQLSHCRQGSAKMLAGAAAAILVFADQAKSDVWTEDCAIVMSNMHLMAHHLGLGSCARARTTARPPTPTAAGCWACPSPMPWRPSSPWAIPPSSPRPMPRRTLAGTRSTGTRFNPSPSPTERARTVSSHGPRPV